MVLMKWKLDDMAPFPRAFPAALMQMEGNHTKHKAYERVFQISTLLECSKETGCGTNSH